MTSLKESPDDLIAMLRLELEVELLTMDEDFMVEDLTLVLEDFLTTVLLVVEEEDVADLADVVDTDWELEKEEDCWMEEAPVAWFPDGLITRVLTCFSSDMVLLILTSYR